MRLSDDVFLKYACLRINEVKMCLGINGVKMWDVYRVSRKGVCSYSEGNSAIMLKIRITICVVHIVHF